VTRTASRRVTVTLVAAASLMLGGCAPDEAPDAGEPDIRSDDEAAAPPATPAASIVQVDGSMSASSSSP
jgi:hypothetical protein